MKEIDKIPQDIFNKMHCKIKEKELPASELNCILTEKEYNELINALK